jgi:hypothetical protein
MALFLFLHAVQFFLIFPSGPHDHATRHPFATPGVFLLPVECQGIVIDVLALNNFSIAED